MKKNKKKDLKLIDKFKKHSLLFRICVLITIIIFILSLIFGLYGYISGGFGYLLTGLVLVLLPRCLILIWGLYFLISLIKNIFKRNKGFGIAFIGFIFLIMLCYFIIGFNNVDKLSVYALKEIYDERSSIIVKDNKLYYSVNEVRAFFNKDVAQDSLNTYDLKTKDNKVLCSEFNGGNEFHFINNNELYYTNVYDEKNYKINLDSCKITNIESNYMFFNNTNDSNIKYMYNSDNVVTYDINTDKIVKDYNIVNTYAINFDNLIIDYDNSNVFYLYKDDEKNETNLYMNDNKLYTFDKYAISLFYFIDNYVFLEDGNYIYQYDYVNNKIVNKTDNEFMSINRINSDNSDCYFDVNGKIYKYNINAKEFEVLLNVDEEFSVHGAYVKHYNNKLVFFNNSEDVIIYDIENNSVKEYEDALFTYDNDVIYVMYEDDDNVIIDEIK